MTHPTADELTAVGVVAGSHGLRGDLKLRPLPTAAAALPHLREIFLAGADGVPVPYRITHSRPHKQQQLVRLAGVDSLEAVQPLLGRTVLARRRDLPARPAGEHYWHELEGLDVVDRRRGLLGTVSGLFATGAHEILTVDGPRGEVLIPFIPPFVTAADPAAGAIRVDLPDGLVPGDED